MVNTLFLYLSPLYVTFRKTNTLNLQVVYLDVLLMWTRSLNRDSNSRLLIVTCSSWVLVGEYFVFLAQHEGQIHTSLSLFYLIFFIINIYKMFLLTIVLRWISREIVRFWNLRSFSEMQRHRQLWKSREYCIITLLNKRQYQIVLQNIFIVILISQMSNADEHKNSRMVTNRRPSSSQINLIVHVNYRCCLGLKDNFFLLNSLTSVK